MYIILTYASGYPVNPLDIESKQETRSVSKEKLLQQLSLHQHS